MTCVLSSVRSGSKTVLGRIVVHDRLSVECNVLPRYFNHNSFASLRRQLNYFSFVRLGKGRQRESAYLNDAVVELDDILTLKRRSSGSGGPVLSSMPPTGAVVVPVSKDQNITDSSIRPVQRRSPKRRPRLVTALPSSSHIISDDEQSEAHLKQQHIALDLTEPPTEEDILAGCSALLGLSTHGWGAE